MSAKNSDSVSEKKHVFADQDAALIYAGLMQLIDSIDDLKHVIVDMRKAGLVQRHA